MVQIRENVFFHVQKLILSRHGFDISAAVVVAIALLLFLLSILKVAIRCGCYARQSCCRL
jgi:hypothetical protein